ncbi:MAG: ThiF family adenylyltransferase [Candidatus Lokiarchaeota archaeon]|nr:ThiF family adenylyltransferase [Candidatus Lokiarchaeota archaeon]
MTQDRYIRLKAIKEFGYDINWDDLRKHHIGIVGVGGLGCVSAEMAVRCGIGKLSLFDFDTVEIVNLNRSMFKEEHIGYPKIEIAAKILKKVNPDVEIKCFNNDIMDPGFEPKFEREIKKMDIILNGLDNIPAREYLNAKCVLFKIPYIDAGASRSGLSGYIHPIIPYKTACAKCLSSITIDLPDEKGEPCVASLPSTMAILASMQIQEMLKYLLKFGEMIDYVMYHMITGKFLNYNTIRDVNCPICGDKAQKGKSDLKSKITQKELEAIIEKSSKNG